MAKPTGITNFSGEVSGVVHVRSSAYGNHTRSKPSVPSSKKAQEGLKTQNTLTPAIVKLASQVRRVGKHYGKKFCPGSFYTGMMDLLRIPQSTTRILMLDALRNYEINKAYPFSRFFFRPKIDIMPLEDSLTVRLTLTEHADYHTDFNCYYLQIVAMIWNTENDDFVEEGKMTSWISVKDELPLGCDFVFAKPENAGDYLVMCHLVTGWNRESSLYFPDQGMRVVEAGSFSAASLRARADHEAARKKLVEDNEAEHARKEVEGERVEMRRI